MEKKIADAVSGVDCLTRKGLIDRSKIGLTGHSADRFRAMQRIVFYPDSLALT